MKYLRAMLVVLTMILSLSASALTFADFEQAKHDLCTSIAGDVPQFDCFRIANQYRDLYTMSLQICSLAQGNTDAQFNCLSWGSKVLTSIDETLNQQLQSCANRLPAEKPHFWQKDHSAEILVTCYNSKISQRLQELNLPAYQ